MKALILDVEAGMGVDLAYRAALAGHDVRYWTKDKHAWGKGLVTRTPEWKESMDWADLVVCTGNAAYPKGFEEYFTKGYPIFGTNPAAAELELDRGKGQEVLKKHGIDTIPYIVVDSLEAAASYLVSTGKPVVIKPWGGEGDKSLTHVCKSVDDGLFTLARWKAEGHKVDRLMLQEKVQGIEVGISGFFGPAGWCSWVEESFEHKKFLVGNLGENTGEMGTVIQHTQDSALFREILEPLTPHLHLLRYVGDCSVNCMVVEGTPLPLEFTMRLGWPDFCIRQALIRSDCLKWMLDLLHGVDSLDMSSKCAVGVVMTHGDFPKEKDEPEKWEGFPLYGLDKVMDHVHFQQAKIGTAPALKGGKQKQVLGHQTAGVYPLVVTGVGSRVRLAKEDCYSHVKEIDWPSNVMYRTDISDRLREDLPELHEYGYCTDIEY